MEGGSLPGKSHLARFLLEVSCTAAWMPRIVASFSSSGTWSSWLGGQTPTSSITCRRPRPAFAPSAVKPTGSASRYLSHRPQAQTQAEVYTQKVAWWWQAMGSDDSCTVMCDTLNQLLVTCRAATCILTMETVIEHKCFW